MGNKSGRMSAPTFHANKNALAELTKNENVAQRLKEVPLLSKYTVEDLGVMGGQFKSGTHAAGTKIICQGDEGDGFYLIDKGEVEVSVEADGKVAKIATLKTNDYFGEAALLNNKARGATVTCTTEVSTFFLSRENFQTLFGKGVHFAKRVAVTAGTDLVHGKTPKAPDGAVKPLAADIMRIRDAVKENLLFAGLDNDVTDKVIGEMWLQDCAAGKDCISQGDKGELFFVVEHGDFAIIVNDKEVTTRGKGMCFGELALMYNAPRAATVRAKVDSKVWVIHRHIFRSTVKTISSTQFAEYSKFLTSVSLLTPLSSAERDKIAGALEQEEVEEKKVIFEQGDEGQTMYIVRKGRVAIHKDGEQVAELKEGDYFGERALQKEEVRAAKAVAVEHTILLVIDKTTFDNLLGPLEAIMSDKIQSYAAAKSAAAAAEDEQKATDIPFANLEVLGTLGKGSFGHVQLVKDKETQETYALKGVSKHMIVETGQQGHILSEKNVMVQMNHPFLIKLSQTYQDKDRLYFLLEPVLGGELFTYLRAQTLFPEDTARFYAACVLLAFEHMHAQDILYRDLKPENILIDSTGFIKITDFGFAKKISGRTWTLCGTPDYLAPEIVAGKGHGKGVDWWTLGILIFEMLASYPPFYDDDTMKTYQKIMTKEIEFPAHFSKAATSILKKLLYRRPTRRLGVVKGGARLIKSHVWFSHTYGTNKGWEQLRDKKIAAPFIPKIAGNHDLTNFDECEEDEEFNAYEDEDTEWCADF